MAKFYRLCGIPGVPRHELFVQGSRARTTIIITTIKKKNCNHHITNNHITTVNTTNNSNSNGNNGPQAAFVNPAAGNRSPMRTISRWNVIPHHKQFLHKRQLRAFPRFRLNYLGLDGSCC